jgi:deoxyribose-phosphate aldolase
LLAAGADLVGTSSGVRIMQELLNRTDAAPPQPPADY